MGGWLPGARIRAAGRHVGPLTAGPSHGRGAEHEPAPDAATMLPLGVPCKPLLGALTNCLRAVALFLFEDQYTGNVIATRSVPEALENS